jgi:hypothetical protein
MLTSSIRIGGGLVVLGVVVRNPSDDDNTVAAVDEGLVVRVGRGVAAADG